MTRPAIIPVGLSGNCLEIYEALTSATIVPAILDDAPRLHGTLFQGLPVLPIGSAGDFPQAEFLCLIGSSRSYRARAGIIASTHLPRTRFARFLHPTARVSGMAILGLGTVAYDGVLVTSNARIGDHVLLMPRCIIHHDVQIMDHSLIGAGTILAGGVQIGPSCYIGSASAIREGVRIGAGALVGMGSVVLRDVEPGMVVAGNPARPLRSLVNT
jgi:sugar O-acyltransferase (sialic acid O-acetyltransferase NeuD family)